MPVTQVTSNYTATSSDYYIGVNGPGVTVTLPVGSTLWVGKTYVIKDESGKVSPNSNYKFNIQTAGPDKIDGTNSITVTVAYIAITVLWTGSFWSII
jgi:hypothetical protein